MKIPRFSEETRWRFYVAGQLFSIGVMVIKIILITIGLAVSMGW